MAFFLAMMMFSLAGIPPLAGFFAKWYVFNAAIQAGLYWLAVHGVLSSAVAAFYYLRIVKVMYFDEPAPAFDKPASAPRAVLAVTGILVVFLFAYPGLFIDATTAAAKSLVLNFSLRWLALFRLAEAAQDKAFRLVHHDQLASTNDEALARARSGDAGRLWVVASAQTNGRGRNGRVWSSPRGNLHASLLLIDPAPIRKAPELGFTTGVATLHALREHPIGRPAACDQMAERYSSWRRQTRRDFIGEQRFAGWPPGLRRGHWRELSYTSRGYTL